MYIFNYRVLMRKYNIIREHTSTDYCKITLSHGYGIRLHTTGLWLNLLALQKCILPKFILIKRWSLNIIVCSD